MLVGLTSESANKYSSSNNRDINHSHCNSLMYSLEGDFQIDDFVDENSDFAQGVFLVNQRFMDGEPGYTG